MVSRRFSLPALTFNVCFSFLLLSLFSPSLSSSLLLFPLLLLRGVIMTKMSLSSYHNSVSFVQLQLLVQSRPVLHMRLASSKIAINSQAKKKERKSPSTFPFSLLLLYLYVLFHSCGSSLHSQGFAVCMNWRLSQNKTLWPQYHQTTLHQLSYGKGERERRVE